MTRNPVVWLQYLCWCIQFWMRTHQPHYPLWLRMWLLPRYSETRHHITWEQVRFWQRNNPDWRLTQGYTPLPWYVGYAALGPLGGPWNRITRIFRGWTGGRSHRCEFTDKQHGALYGHREGAFMDRLFERLIWNIDQKVPE